jgi:hypothetical protein
MIRGFKLYFILITLYFTEKDIVLCKLGYYIFLPSLVIEPELGFQEKAVEFLTL